MPNRGNLVSHIFSLHKINKFLFLATGGHQHTDKCTKSPPSQSTAQVTLKYKHLKFGHSAEVIVPEEDTQFSLLYGRGEFTQAMVC